jgi:hypothetical protein
MLVTVIGNRRWFVLSPSRYRLAWTGKPIDMVFDGAGWHLTDGKTAIAVPDIYTAAMMLHKRLNALACARPDDGDFTSEHLTEPLL